MKNIVYSASKNYFVHKTDKGFEVQSPYGYSGTFKTQQEAINELSRLLIGNP